MNKLPVGSRVEVADIDGTGLGLGTYVGDVPLSEAEPTSLSAGPSVEVPAHLTELIAEAMESGATTPKIVLDDGRILYGFECWWTEATIT